MDHSESYQRKNKHMKISLLSYVPAPEEMPLFESLYQICNLTSRGARDVLLLSELQDNLISMILDMTQSYNRVRLNRSQFYVAVRLIQLYQNGVPISNLNLTVPDHIHLYPPYFKGISNIESGFYKENLRKNIEHFSLSKLHDKLPGNNMIFISRSCPSLNISSARPEIQKMQRHLSRNFSNLRRALKVDKTKISLKLCLKA